jgi:hypothetical protein
LPRDETLNATGPLFAGPAAAHGIHWMAVLALVVGAAAAVLLLWGLIRGRLPASFAAAAVLLPIAAYGLAARARSRSRSAARVIRWGRS